MSVQGGTVCLPEPLPEHDQVLVSAQNRSE